MRNISFALTTPQIRARTKTVTRRCGTWWSKVLKPGDLLCAVEKSQGIKKGGLVRLGVIRVVSVRVERLDAISWEDVDREGFSHIGHNRPQRVREFIGMFCRHMGGDPTQIVTRIEFEYVEAPSGAGGEGT